MDTTVYINTIVMIKKEKLVLMGLESFIFTVSNPGSLRMSASYIFSALPTC